MSEIVPQLGQRAIPPYQAAGQRGRCGGRGAESAVFDRCDEPVAPSRHRLDEVRSPRWIIERPAEVEDLLLDGLRLDEGVRPGRIEQFAVGDQSAGVLHQVAQDFEALWRQQDALIRPRFAGAPEALVDAIETEGREQLHGGASTGTFSEPTYDSNI